MDAKKPTDDTINQDDPTSLQGESLEVKDFSPTQDNADDSQSTSSGSVISPTSPSSDDNGVVKEPSVTSAVAPGADKPTPKHLGKLWERVNVYLLIFILIVAASIAVIVIVFMRGRSVDNAGNNINQQQLSPEALQELASNGVQVGDPKQVLNVQSNTVFAGTALVKGELQVAGGLKIGSGGLDIPELTIGGTAIVSQLQAQTLAVAGNTAVQGQLSVQQNLTVNGTGSFNGAITTPQLTTARLQLSGDLTLTRHIVAGGAIPGRTNGGGLGAGGTSSLSGSDTAGTITINTGGGAGAGCMVTVNFAQAFTSTPHVSITPIGSAAAGIDYYVNRSSTNFSVCSINNPPSNASFGFDYIVLD